MTTKAQQAERDEYAAKLRKIFPLNSTIYTYSETPTRNNVQAVSVFITDRYGDGSSYIRRLNHLVSLATGNKLTDGAFRLGGYGYSKTFQVVYGIGRALYPDGYTCTGDDCMSNDHSNGSARDGIMHHSDGGYAFNQSSL